MNTLATSLLAGTTLAVAAAAGTSYYMGGKIQQAIVTTADSWGEDQEVAVRLVHYERGVFTSSARSIWTFAGNDTTHEVQVTHDIRHGPFPRGYAAQVHTVFHLPDDIDPALTQALQGKHPLQWTAQVRWNQEARHTVQADSFQAKFDDGSTLDWGGLQAQWTMQPDGLHIQGSAQLPLLDVQTPSAQMRLRMQDLQLQLDNHKSAQYQFWSGPLQLQLAQLQVEDPEAPTFSVEDMDLTASSDLVDNLVQMRIQTQAAQAGTTDQQVQNAQLHITLTNIDANWLTQAVAWMHSSEAEEELQSWALLSSLPQLLAGHPEIAITHLQFQTSDGVSEFAARMGYTGEDPEAFTLIDLNATLQATLPQSVLEHLLSAKVRNDYVALLEQMGQPMDETSLGAAIQDGVRKRLQSLISQGAIHPTGNRFTSELTFDGDGFQLNGQPTKLHDLLMLGEAI